MGQSSSPIAAAARALFTPIDAHKRQLLAERWNELPEDLQQPWQVVGQQFSHCAYTMGPSFCSFGCTHCYLPHNANSVPLPSLESMKEQVDANAALIGAGGGLQLTGGDLLDAYWRYDRQEELVTLARYANDRGVVPMLMTHGQKLLEHPEFLDRLVVEGGMRKLAVHIDATQAGRPGFPIKAVNSEADLHPLREQFVDLILESRKRTGITFAAAHTVTVTRDNLNGVAPILRWLLASPRRLDAFRMVSFQPEADQGRSRLTGVQASPAETWEQICAGVELPLSRDTLWFGDPDCSSMATVLRCFDSETSIDLMPTTPTSRDYWGWLLGRFGGVGSRGERPWVDNARRVGLALRNPSVLPRTLRYARDILRGAPGGAKPIRSALRRQARPLNIVMHNFMDAQQLAAPRADAIEKRLQACSFRGAVKRDGDWVAEPMCSMNSGERETIYDSLKVISNTPNCEGSAAGQ